MSDSEDVPVHTVAIGTVALVLLGVAVLSVPALFANDHFVVTAGYHGRWPIFVPTALIALALPAIAIVIGFKLPATRDTSVGLGIGIAALWLLVGWWVYLFIQPMLLHMVTKQTDTYELVSAGGFARQETSRRGDTGRCPMVEGRNETLGSILYCIRDGQAYLANPGNVVRLSIDVSPFATWISGSPEQVLDSNGQPVTAPVD